MSKFKKQTFAGTGPMFCLPRSIYARKDTKQKTSLFELDRVHIPLVDQASLLPGIATYSLEAFAQLTWALLLREYIGIGDPADVVFGVLKCCYDKLRLEQQSFSLKQSVKVHDALTALATLRAEECTPLGWCPVQSAVYVRQPLDASEALLGDFAFSDVGHQKLTSLKLIIVIEYISDKLIGYLLYDSREVKTFVAESLSHSFSVTLKHIALNVLAEIGDISCLAPEHEKQMSLWNSNHLESWPRKLHQIFEQMAVCKCQDVAIESYEGTFTFGQLDRLSDSVMTVLQSAGTHIGDPVGHCFNLGVCAIVATLAIFKAGCVLVPLDPTHPAQRHSHALHNVHARLLLSDCYFKSQELALGVSIISLDLETLGDYLFQPRPLVSKPKTSCDDAVICFTSGSTGAPKGIVQTHEGLATMVRALSKRLCINSDTRISGLHPHVFDISIMETFSAFLVGAVLCIPRREDMMIPQPHHLGKALAAYAVTHVVLSPTMLKTLDADQVPSLRVLMSMGESLDHDLLDRWAGREQFDLFQLWGTTEASILQSCTEPMQLGQDPQCVGKALPGVCRLWIVSCRDDSRLVPVGAIDEIVVEGPALARGYLGDETRTKSSFIHAPNWLNLKGNFGFYKTGDLARYDSDGSIVFVGRRDTQVNLHGERVELGEIDYHLLQLRIEDVTDILSDFIWDSQTIVAFCCLKRVQRQPKMPTIVVEDVHQLRDSLKGARERLRQHLPSYMLPQPYFTISKRPVTATGKTDRKIFRELVASMTETELKLFSDLDL